MVGIRSKINSQIQKQGNNARSSEEQREVNYEHIEKKIDLIRTISSIPVQDVRTTIRY